MSAIAGIFATGGVTPPESVARRMLEAMRARGGVRSAVWARDGALLAAARHEWECGGDLAGDVLIAADDDLVVVADASIYYREDLRAAASRRGALVASDAASDLILAAYRAWGDDCADRLEGDFAFIVWNRKTRRVCAARDFAGKRSLYWAQLGGTLVVASTVGGVLAHPECPDDLNLTAIAETAAGMFAASHETAYRAIQTVNAGWTLARRGDDAYPEVFRHFTPPRVRDEGALPFDEGALALRALLQRATAERIPSSGPTAVWLSGGWDSTAVFAVAAQELREQGTRAVTARARVLRPVTVSYPADDPGREDELVQMVAGAWGASVQWVDIADVPFFDRPEQRALQRDEPFAHAFEMWHRALAHGSRAVGARVALDGMGGDQLFQVSEVYLADLLRRGRWVELARECRAKGMRANPRAARAFWTWAVRPALGDGAMLAASLLGGGRRTPGYLERRPPAWMNRGFVRSHHLEDRERAHAPQRGRVSCAAYETEWYLSHPYFPRVFGYVYGFAEEEGVELRSPLYDRRVLEFALARPRWERASGRQTKLLLRRAVRGLLPDAVLAPRPVRTGITSGYFARSMREHFPALVERVVEHAVLAEIGIIDAGAFRRACNEYVQHGGDQLGVNLLFTLQAELWLRSRVRPVNALVGRTSTARAEVANS